MTTTVEQRPFEDIRNDQHEIIDVDDWIMNRNDFRPRRLRSIRTLRPQTIGLEERPANRRRLVSDNADIIVLDDSDDDDIQLVEGPSRVARDLDQPAVFRRRRGSNFSGTL